MGRLSQGAKSAVVSRAMKELRFFHFVRASWEGEGEGVADGSIWSGWIS